MIEGVFPDEIYVIQSEDTNDDESPYSLSADEKIEGLEGLIEEGQPVAVYKLVHVGKIITSRRFVAPPNGSKK